MNRKTNFLSLKMLIVFALMLIMAQGVFAASSAESVSSNGWFKSGGVTVKIYRIENGSKTLYTSGQLEISRTTVTNFDASKTTPYEWDVELTGGDGKMSLASDKASSQNSVIFSDPYYAHDANYTWAGHYGFAIDLRVLMPKGYKYQVNSMKADTKELNDEGTNKRAMTLYLPKTAYESYPQSDETKKVTMVIHGTNLGILSLEKTRYTGNSIEMTLEPNDTMVEFDSNGGTGSMTSQKVTYGSVTKVVKNSFTRTGYKFSEWNTKKDGSGKSYANSADIGKAFPGKTTATLYARWKGNETTVKFNANAGKGSMTDQKLTYGKSANLKANAFTREGYKFVGWNTKKDGSGTTYSNRQSVTTAFPSQKEVTLYAQWKGNECAVKFDANGGEGSMPDQTVVYASNAKLHKNAYTRYGYAFAGWNTRKNGTGKKYEDGANVNKVFPTQSNFTMYAQWKEIKLSSIKFTEKEIIGTVNTSRKAELTFAPANTLDKSVKFSSSNPKIVHVTADGTMAFMRRGTAKVTAYRDDKIRATVSVTVDSDYGNYAKKAKSYMAVSVYQIKYKTAKLKLTTNYAYTNYRIHLKKSGKSYKLLEKGKGLKTYTIKNLSPGTKYIVRVKLKVKGKWKSRETSFYTNSVIKLDAVPQADGSVKLSWTKFKGAVGYTIERKKRSTSTDDLFYKKIKTTKNTEYIDKDVSEKTKYYYKVVAYKYETKHVTKKTKKGKKIKKKKKKILSPYSNPKLVETVGSPADTPADKQDEEKTDTQTDEPIDAQKNMEFVKNDIKTNGDSSIWNCVIMDNRNVNDYYIPQDYMDENRRILDDNYPAVRYKFTGAELEIHLYLEFVQYTIKKEGGITYSYKANADNVTYDGTNNYKNLCMEGLFKYYDKVKIKGNANDFKAGFSFETKLFVHDKNTGNCYTSPTTGTGDVGINEDQYYIPVCLGGECPVHNGYVNMIDHWYHHDGASVKVGNNIIDETDLYGPRDNVASCIYMPEYSQVIKNKYEFSNIPFDVAQIPYVFAHEMGHALGLGDGYTENGIDRMTDNEETCKMIKVKGEKKGYDNLMYQKQYDINEVVIMPNDIEMMLTAYTNSYGHPWVALNKQWYKTHANNVISPVIINQNDEDEY